MTTRKVNISIRSICNDDEESKHLDFLHSLFFFAFLVVMCFFTHCNDDEDHFVADSGSSVVTSVGCTRMHTVASVSHTGQATDRPSSMANH
eukprot:SAG31_NODE_15557_length_749_cov_0.841538_1_plen_91_part_00